MGSSIPINETKDTTKQRKIKGSKGSSPLETQFARPAFATGNDARSPKQAPSSPSLIPSPSKNTTRISIREYPRPNLPSPSRTATAEVIDNSSTAAVIDNTGSYLRFLKFGKYKQKGTSASHASFGELAMGFFIVLCFVWPGIVGRMPLVPRLVYEAVDPFSSFAYTKMGGLEN